MSREDYLVMVCPGYGVGISGFDVDYLLTDNLIRGVREHRVHGQVYRVGIIPEAIPHAVRLLKERRWSYSGLYSGLAEAKDFYLCFETWAAFQWPTDEVRRLSDPELLAAKERDIKQYTKPSLKRLDEMYSALKKADEENINVLSLVRVGISNITRAKKNPKKELFFFQGGVKIFSVDELRGYPIEDQQALLAGLIDDPHKVVLDPITKAVFTAIADAERPFLLFDDGGEERAESAEPPAASAEEGGGGEKETEGESKVLIKGWADYLYRNDVPDEEEQATINKIKQSLSELECVKRGRKGTASWDKPARSFSYKANIESGRIFFNQHESYALGKDKQGSWWARKKAENSPFWAWHKTLRENMKLCTND